MSNLSGYTDANGNFIPNENLNSGGGGAGGSSADGSGGGKCDSSGGINSTMSEKKQNQI